MGLQTNMLGQEGPTDGGNRLAHHQQGLPGVQALSLPQALPSLGHVRVR